MSRQDNLIKKIYDGVRRLATIQSRTKEQAQDFLQEGLMCAFEAIERYKEKPDDELVRIIAVAARNKIYEIQRGEVTFYFRHKVTEIEEDARFEYPFAEFENDNFVRVLRSRLRPDLQILLDEKINPSDKTIGIVELEMGERQTRREAGELVMNLTNDRVRDVHLAESLGVSKATICRGVKQIQEATETLIREL
jgi:DNA-directed RNA polymerase specialized sigma24 family protein